MGWPCASTASSKGRLFLEWSEKRMEIYPWRTATS